MKRVRQRKQIVLQILGICSGGASKTKIVMGANLNYKSVNPYIDLLIFRDLIKLKREYPTLYVTTDKGIKFMSDLKAILSNLSWDD